MSALFKRAEQLKRWEESDTNRESAVRKNIKTVSFPIDCAFLASVASGDKNEVNSLLYFSADINAANADGLTALHQACIDDNLDMVEFLVEHGADVNRGDKEGWTPLHATASCGFISIAKYLLDHGADVSAINCDQELATDIAESDDMRQLLEQHLKAIGIDCDEARNKEERLMLKDAREWISTGKFKDSPHATSGAMAIHVSAAKGYIKVLELLIQAGADINCQDYDGWTPLHAAAYWGQKEACEILVEHFCDMKKKNFVGQTAYDVSDDEMKDLLDELKKKQASQNKDPSDKNYLISNKLPNSQNQKRKSSISRLSGNDKSTLKKDKETVLDRNQVIKEEEDDVKIKDDPTKRQKVEIELTPIEQLKPENNNGNTIKEFKQPVVPSSGNNELKPPEVVLRRTQSFESDEKFYRRYCELRAKIKGNLWGVIHPSSSTASASPPMRTASLKEKPLSRRNKSNFRDDQTNSATAQSSLNSNDTTHPSTNIRRSFVPPVRDDESETQRKAHAKRVRETRRSTQGVTLEELKSAEQIVKQKNQDTGKSKLNSSPVETNNNSTNNIGTPQAKTEEHVTVTATITPLPRNIPSNMPDSCLERRPSWRLRVDNGSKFLLEDARSNEAVPNSPTKSHIPSSLDANADTTITLPLRRPSPKEIDDKDQDKENEFRNHQATQAVIQRRKRPKRRSTGVVHVDLDEIDPDRQDTSSCGGTDDSIGEELSRQLRPRSVPADPLPSSSSSQTPFTMNPYNSKNVRKSRPSSSYVSTARPRSVYSSPSRAGSSVYSSFGLSAPSSSSSYLGSSPSSHHHYSSSSSGVPSYSTYGGTASGYGGLTIAPSSSSPSFSSYMGRASAAASPSSRQSHVSSRHSHVSPSAAASPSSSSRHSHASPSSRHGGPLKRSYYQSPLSRFDSSNSLASSKSYGSEGYASGGDTKTSSPSSRLCSISSSQDSKPGSGANSPGPCSENGDLDYKALYEEVVVDNERLRRQLQKTEEDLLEARITIEKQSTNAGKSTTLSETEKRERRAMERKLSEMEEELKQMEQLRQENQRLKDENGALIRVISKLSK